MISLENIDQAIQIELDKMRDAANIGDMQIVESKGIKVITLAKNALLLARRRGRESELIYRAGDGSISLS